MLFNTGNEKLDVFLSVTLLIVWIIALGVISVYVARSYRKKLILSLFAPTNADVTKLLRLTFGKNNVLKNVYLPMYDGDNVISYIFADTILLLPTCIVVMRLRGEAGLIYCDEGYDWHQSARLSSGGTLETDFTDPIPLNRDAMTALRRIFAKAKLDEPQIRGMIVFTPKSVRFSSQRPGVYNLKDAYSGLRRLACGEKLPKGAVEEYRKLIFAKRVRKSVADNYNIKKLT